MWYIYTVECYSTIKKNKIMPFAATWMDLEIIILSEVSQKVKDRASLVAQWQRICLPMQGTWVRSLVQEDPTCHGATKPMRHNY